MTFKTNSARIGANLKAERKLAGMTQQEAADILGVTRKTIGNWEMGVYDISSGDLISLLYEYSARRPQELPTVSLDDILDFRPARYDTGSGLVQITARDEEHLTALANQDEF